MDVTLVSLNNLKQLGESCIEMSNESWEDLQNWNYSIPSEVTTFDFYYHVCVFSTHGIYMLYVYFVSIFSLKCMS